MEKGNASSKSGSNPPKDENIELLKKKHPSTTTGSSSGDSVYKKY